MRLVAICALCLVASTGCDALFGLTHIKEQGSAGDDDASVIDTSSTDVAIGGRDAAIDAVDAYVQKSCSQLTGYISTNGSYYRGVTTAPKNWINAQVDCQDDVSAANTLHTHLVVLSNDIEANAVWVNVLGSPSTAGGFWVGLADSKNEGIFQWVTDEATNYPSVTTWDTNEPNGSTTENCVFDTSLVKMQTIPCTESHVYACECDAFATDSTNF